MTRKGHVPPIHHGASRRGFTVIEMMVAMVVLTIGLLAMVGTSAVVRRQMTGTQQQTLAAMMAQSRLEQLRSTNCQTITGGTAITRGITEVWVTTNVARAVIVTDTVKYTTRSGQRVQRYTSTIPCPLNP